MAKRVAIGWGLFCAAGMAGAQTPAPETPPTLCAAAAPFAAWDRPTTRVAATRADRDPPPPMTPGEAAAVTLSPTSDVTPVVAPGRAGRVAGYAGLLRLRVPLPGTYRFGLSGPAWLDVIDRGAPAVSTAHGHGETCEPVRKLVDLPLSAGEHLVQFTDAPTPNVTIMAVRVGP